MYVLFSGVGMRLTVLVPSRDYPGSGVARTMTGLTHRNPCKGIIQRRWPV